MEDMYMKPGNQERGWNDPPQFSYGLQMARGPQRNLLNKRAAPPGAGAPPMTPPSSSPSAPPLSGVAPPPLSTARPPPANMATPPRSVEPMKGQKEVISSQSEPDVDGVLLVLSRALAACRLSVKEQVCNDVAKRLRLLEDSWRAGRLSLPVRRRMDNLSLELQSGRWDSADEIHRSLMVDHVTEVSQWMVGVKRLIAETRKLSPELLEPLQNPGEPVQDSPGPVLDSAAPVQDSPGPVQNSPGQVQDSPGTAQDSAAPAQDSPAPAQDSPGPAQDSPAPAQDSAAPAQDSPAPAQDSPGPVQDSPATVQDSAAPAQDSPGPVQDSPATVQDSPGPVQEPVSQ